MIICEHRSIIFHSGITLVLYLTSFNVRESSLYPVRLLLFWRIEFLLELLMWWLHCIMQLRRYVTILILYMLRVILYLGLRRRRYVMQRYILRRYLHLQVIKNKKSNQEIKSRNQIFLLGYNEKQRDMPAYNEILDVPNHYLQLSLWLGWLLLLIEPRCSILRRRWLCRWWHISENVHRIRHLADRWRRHDLRRRYRLRQWSLLYRRTLLLMLDFTGWKRWLRMMLRWLSIWH